MGVLSKTDPATVNRPHTEEFPTPSRKRARRGPHPPDRPRAHLAHEDSAEQIQGTFFVLFENSLPQDCQVQNSLLTILGSNLRLQKQLLHATQVNSRLLSSLFDSKNQTSGLESLLQMLSSAINSTIASSLSQTFIESSERNTNESDEIPPLVAIPDHTSVQPSVIRITSDGDIINCLDSADNSQSSAQSDE